LREQCHLPLRFVCRQLQREVDATVPLGLTSLFQHR
jgi:hypothetical protein